MEWPYHWHAEIYLSYVCVYTKGTYEYSMASDISITFNSQYVWVGLGSTVRYFSSLVTTRHHCDD